MPEQSTVVHRRAAPTRQRVTESLHPCPHCHGRGCDEIGQPCVACAGAGGWHRHNFALTLTLHLQEIERPEEAPGIFWKACIAEYPDIEVYDRHRNNAAQEALGEGLAYWEAGVVPA